MWTVNGETGAAGVRRLATQLVLIFPGAKRGDDLQVFLTRCEFALGAASKTERLVSDCRGDHALVGGIGLALNLPELLSARGVVKIGDRSGEQLAGLGWGAIL